MGLVSCIGGSENDENTLTNCGALGWPTSWLPKFKVVGDTDPEFCPWPLSDAVKGMAPGVAVLTVNVPLRSPGAVGLNATCIVQDAPLDMAPQLFVCWKSPVV